MRPQSLHMTYKTGETFGSPLIGRSYEADTLNGYRFGFNGKEKIDNINGDGNGVDFGERMYYSRLGRFLSIDPLTKDSPELSPYPYAGNTPIQAIDLDGLKKYHYTRSVDENGKTVLTLTKVETVYKLVQTGWRTSISGGNDGLIPVYTKVEDTKDEHIVHQKDTKYYDGVYGLGQEVTYDEQTSFATYEDASNCSDADFTNTSADFVFLIQQGLSNVAQETQANGGPIVKTNTGLTNKSLVVRGGICTEESFKTGSGVKTGADGKLSGISVNASTSGTVKDLSKTLKNNQVGVTTYGELKKAGARVTPSPSGDTNPDHHTLSNISGKDASNSFKVQPNPSKGAGKCNVNSD